MNHYSLKKIDELNAEVPVRIALCKRAGGKPIIKEQRVYHNSTAYLIQRVICSGGVCEHCGKPANYLEPHETPKRSQGGKVSLEQSKMVHRSCHRRLDGRNPQFHWLKGAE